MQSSSSTPSAAGVLFVASDVDAAHDLDYNRWYDREHVLERVSIPGFTCGTRYVAIDAPKRYLGLYHTESLAVFGSPAYRQAFLHQTPWSVSNLNRMQQPMRRVCQVLARTGAGQGSALLVIQLPLGSTPAQLEDQVLGLGARLSELDGFVHCCLYLPDETLSTPLPQESAEGRVLHPMLLVHASSRTAAEGLRAQALEQLGLDGAPAGLYALGWQLHAADL
jgi:hypothetical protein